MSATVVLVWYIEEISDWFKNGNGIINKVYSLISHWSWILIPVISFYVSYNFAKAYFEEHITTMDKIALPALTILQMFFIVVYCYELIDINKDKENNNRRGVLFITIVIHIIQIFANIYLLLLILDKNTLCVTSKTPFELCFDLTYFSTMTFVGGDSIYSPGTRLVQAVVLVESMIFSICISILLFNNLLSKNRSE